MSIHKGRFRLGVDVGGTFTDLLLFDEGTGNISLVKVPTTPDNQAKGILSGIARIITQSGVSVEQISLFMHGTTAATNAILEYKGARTALITTMGFRDVLHIMRQDRPKLYDFRARRPDPLVPRKLRFEVSERVLYDGRVERPLDIEGLEKIARKITREGVQSVAVCLLHSYANPVHERQIRDSLRTLCPDVYISISSEVLPEIKEYQRTSTTVINAYVQPVIQRYVNNLRSRLDAIGLTRTVHIMQSNGGIMPSSLAATNSASTILSGPAAGVLGGVALASQAGEPNVITVDMGGTSFDICLSAQGSPTFSTQSDIGGHVLKVPMLDIHTIGAGGGSVAWIDAGQVLKVGPRSAGADPGPACYGRGGSEPTVTDANLLLGRLDEEYFLGGDMAIDRESARTVIERDLAAPLGMDVFEVAEGIIRVVNAAMVKGIRFVSVEKGHDPREFSLVCFGGNGPLHAGHLARELGVPRVIIPFAPGVNCAYGLLTADFRYDYVQTYLRTLSSLDLEEMNGVLSAMEDEAVGRMAGDEVPRERIRLVRTVDLRYLGQGYEIGVPLSSGPVTQDSLRSAEEAFHVKHDTSYGYRLDGEQTQIVNIRIACVGEMPRPVLTKEPLADSSPREAHLGRREVYLDGSFRDIDIYLRDRLLPGARIDGPAIIEQRDSTTLVHPSTTAVVDPWRNIIITQGDSP